MSQLINTKTCCYCNKIGEFDTFYKRHKDVWGFFENLLFDLVACRTCFVKYQEKNKAPYKSRQPYTYLDVKWDKYFAKNGILVNKKDIPKS
jgi:hypothetical protein